MLIDCLPLTSGLSGGCIVGVGYIIIFGLDHYLGAFIVFSLWGAGLIFGGQALNLREPKSLRLLLRLGRPSWSYAFFTATVPVLLVFATERELLEGLFYTGVGTHVTYLGVKYRCDLIGCCWARRRTAFRLPLDQLRLGLQKFECLATGCILVFALPLHNIGYPAASVLMLYTGHSAVRSYSNYLKQPKLIWRQNLPYTLSVAFLGVAGIVLDQLIVRLKLGG